jgi:hypothetical protein
MERPKLRKRPIQADPDSSPAPLEMPGQEEAAIVNFSDAIAVIQVCLELLTDSGASSLDSPLLTCWLDVPCRYTLTLIDYWDLANQLEHEWKKTNAQKEA